jgi:hypothetical protein
MLASPTRTAVYGPVRTVVWQGSAGDRRPYADQTRLCLETQYFKLIGRLVISSWVTAVGDFIRFYSVTSS